MMAIFTYVQYLQIPCQRVNIWFCLPLWRTVALKDILGSLILGTNYACDDTAFKVLCKVLRNQKKKQKMHFTPSSLERLQRWINNR